jgi:DNA-binding NtrC family response regulator
MQGLLLAAERAAASDDAVLLVGETGTGKEAIARWMHERSPRNRGPLVVCDVSTMPQRAARALFGKRQTGSGAYYLSAFVRAQTGTLYVDDVGDLDASCQERLLCAIDRKEIRPSGTEGSVVIDVRVIAATRHDLEHEVMASRFSAPLYRRLLGTTLATPPLRERGGDLAQLVAYAVEELVEAQGRPPPTVSAAALQALQAHDWPGNLHELRAVLSRALTLAPSSTVLEVDHIHLDGAPDSAVARRRPWPTFKEAKDALLDEWESDYLKALMERAGGNVTLAAEFSGLARGHLYRLLKKRGLYR